MKTVWALALVAAVAGCSKAPEVVRAEREHIEEELPAGCEIHDFGEYNDLRRLVVVTCDGARTTSTNYTWTVQQGKTRTTRQAVAVVVEATQP